MTRRTSGCYLVLSFQHIVTLPKTTNTTRIANITKVTTDL
ncbi:hypothetical protein FDUTEX481_04548 [Tolypothrix sp. PCC 7601]|nr:hypothetical protein FDUTEX481_04548 [Tolypothrix sp. PCC 7601]